MIEYLYRYFVSKKNPKISDSNFSFIKLAIILIFPNKKV